MRHGTAMGISRLPGSILPIWRSKPEGLEASLLFLLAVPVLSCHGSRGPTAATSATDRPRFLVVHAVEPDLSPRLDRLSRMMAANHGPEVRFVSDSAPGPLEDRETTVILAGVPARFPRLLRELEDYPWQPHDPGFSFAGQRYADPDTTLTIVPTGRRRPWLVSSDSSRGAIRSLTSLLWRQGRIGGDFHIVTPEEGLERTGFFREGGPPFQVDPGRDRDGRKEKASFLRSLVEAPGADSSRVQVVAPPGQHGADELGRSVTRIAAQVGLSPGARVVLYPDAVMKGRFTQDASEAHLEPATRVVHALADTAVEAQIALALARLAARESLGKAARPWLVEGWAHRLLGDAVVEEEIGLASAFAAGDILPTLEELSAQDQKDDEPGTIFGAAATSLLEALTRRLGEHQAKGLAASGDPLSEVGRLGGRSSLQKIWSEFLGPAPLCVGRRAIPQGFMKGSNLAMTNRLDRGYQSEGCGRMLERLHGLGIGWIAVMPFGFVRGTKSAAIHIVLDGVGGETDAAMRHVIRAAHARGLKVLYKPHLWVSHGNWVGEIAMPDDTSWSRWFLAYRRFAVHHALIARQAGAEMFSVGTELLGTTGRAEDWRRVIAAVRCVFPGPVTYTANWGSEFESLPFAASLDVVGLDAYYPLSSLDHPTDEELTAGVQAIRDRIDEASKRWDRPVFLAEIGFPSTPRPWLSPHEERSAPPDPEAQARCYRAVLRGLAGSDRIVGLFWWKVESDPQDGGFDDPSFTFAGKPAEREIRSAWSGKAL